VVKHRAKLQLLQKRLRHQPLQHKTLKLFRARNHPRERLNPHQLQQRRQQLLPHPLLLPDQNPVRAQHPNPLDLDPETTPLVVAPVWDDLRPAREITPSDHRLLIDQPRPAPVGLPAHQGPIPAACQRPAVLVRVAQVVQVHQIVVVPVVVAQVGQVDSVHQIVVVPVVVAQVAHRLLQAARAVQVDPVDPVDPVALVVEVVLVLVLVAVAPRLVHLVVPVVDHRVGASPSVLSARNSTTWKHHRWVVSGCRVETEMSCVCPGARA
jgi:hypothetical protein